MPKKPYGGDRTATKVVGRQRESVEVSLGRAPKKLTKGVREQLKKLHRQNPSEFDRQCALNGIGPNEFIRRYMSGRK